MGFFLTKPVICFYLMSSGDKTSNDRLGFIFMCDQCVKTCQNDHQTVAISGPKLNCIAPARWFSMLVGFYAHLRIWIYPVSDPFCSFNLLTYRPMMSRRPQLHPAIPFHKSSQAFIGTFIPYGIMSLNCSRFRGYNKNWGEVYHNLAQRKLGGMKRKKKEKREKKAKGSDGVQRKSTRRHHGSRGSSGKRWNELDPLPCMCVGRKKPINTRL